MYQARRGDQTGLDETDKDEKVIYLGSPHGRPGPARATAGIRMHAADAAASEPGGHHPTCTRNKDIYILHSAQRYGRARITPILLYGRLPTLRAPKISSRVSQNGKFSCVFFLSFPYFDQFFRFFQKIFSKNI